MRITNVPYRAAGRRPELVPLVDVYLLGPRGRERIQCVLDTGAIYSVLWERVAQDVGLSLPIWPNYTIQYGGSVAVGRRIRVHIELARQRFATDVVFVERPLPLPYGLLGRQGVFNRFNEVVFIERVRPPRIELRW
jgi:hypothetical protein